MSLGAPLMQIVRDRRIRASFDEQLHHRNVPVLRRHVQRGDALAMIGSAESGFVIDACAVINQPPRGFHAIAPGGPDERGSSIGIGIQARPGPEKPGKDLRATALAGPNQRLVQDLLRIGGGLPIREPTMRSVKSPCRTGLHCQRRLSAEATLQQVFAPESRTRPEVSWRYGAATQQIAYLPMAPE